MLVMSLVGSALAQYGYHEHHEAENHKKHEEHHKKHEEEHHVDYYVYFN